MSFRVHVFPRFAQASLGSIQPVDIREWISDLDRSGLSTSRIRQAYFLLGQILRSAAESGYLAKSPCAGVKLPRMQVPEMRFLTVDQVGVLATTISNPYGALINTLAYGGLSRGEVAALRRGRCELLRSRLNVVESLSETLRGSAVRSNQDVPASNGGDPGLPKRSVGRASGDRS